MLLLSRDVMEVMGKISLKQWKHIWTVLLSCFLCQQSRLVKFLLPSPLSPIFPDSSRSPFLYDVQIQPFMEHFVIATISVKIIILQKEKYLNMVLSPVFSTKKLELVQMKNSKRHNRARYKMPLMQSAFSGSRSNEANIVELVWKWSNLKIKWD